MISAMAPAELKLGAASGACHVSATCASVECVDLVREGRDRALMLAVRHASLGGKFQRSGTPVDSAQTETNPRVQALLTHP